MNSPIMSWGALTAQPWMLVRTNSNAAGETMSRNEKKSQFVSPAQRVCLPTQQVVLVVERIPVKNEEGQTSKKEFETKLLVGNLTK